MDFAPRRPAHDLIACVHHVEPLVAAHGAIPLLSRGFVPFRAFAKFIMAKIDVSKVAEILKKNHIDPTLLRRVIEEMNLAVQPDPGDDEKPPSVKKQFVVLLSDPEGRMPKNDFVGWILQIPESES